MFASFSTSCLWCCTLDTTSQLPKTQCFPNSSDVYARLIFVALFQRIVWLFSRSPQNGLNSLEYRSTPMCLFCINSHKQPPWRWQEAEKGRKTVENICFMQYHYNDRVKKNTGVSLYLWGYSCRAKRPEWPKNTFVWEIIEPGRPGNGAKVKKTLEFSIKMVPVTKIRPSSSWQVWPTIASVLQQAFCCFSHPEEVKEPWGGLRTTQITSTGGTLSVSVVKCYSYRGESRPNTCVKVTPCVGPAGSHVGYRHKRRYNNTQEQRTTTGRRWFTARPPTHLLSIHNRKQENIFYLN